MRLCGWLPAPRCVRGCARVVPARGRSARRDRAQPVPDVHAQDARARRRAGCASGCVTRRSALVRAARPALLRAAIARPVMITETASLGSVARRQAWLEGSVARGAALRGARRPGRRLYLVADVRAGRAGRTARAARRSSGTSADGACGISTRRELRRVRVGRSSTPTVRRRGRRGRGRRIAATRSAHAG